MNRRHHWEFYEGDPVKWWAQSPPYQPRVGVIIEKNDRGLPGWKIRRDDGKTVYVATNRLELFRPEPRPLNHRHTDTMQQDKPTRKKSFPSTERGTWFILHQEDSLLVTGDRLPYIHRTPIKLGKHTISPGDKLDFLGGHKESAGFKVLDFRPRGENDSVGPIEFVGSMLDYFIKDKDSPPEPAKDTKTSLVLFRDSGLREGAFYAWYYDGKDFFFGTRAMALRVIEHDRTTPHGQPVPERDLSKKGKHSRAAAGGDANPGLALEAAEAQADEDDAEDEEPPAAPGVCDDCKGSGWYIKPGHNCLSGWVCDCRGTDDEPETAPADRVAGWPAIIRHESEQGPHSVEDVAAACLAKDWDAQLFLDELRDSFHGEHFRGTTTMDVVDAAGGEALVAATYENRRKGQRSQALLELLTKHGYSKKGTPESGITTKGLNLVKNIAVAKGLKRWQDCATVEDYDALISAVRAKLEKAPAEPITPLESIINQGLAKGWTRAQFVGELDAMRNVLRLTIEAQRDAVADYEARQAADSEPKGWDNVPRIPEARPIIRDLEPGELIAVFTECKRCWHLEFWPDALGVDLNFHACPKCGNHDLAWINETQPAFAILKAELDKNAPAA